MGRKGTKRVLEMEVVSFESVTEGRTVPGSDLDVTIISESTPTRAEVAHRILREAGLSKEHMELVRYETGGVRILGTPALGSRVR